mmetsp:Transcript_37272/g.81151  ORF Transcript_37272/g.81151 Transcript_37272/m.81151 type:complete len:96 (+) Transcript_37272:1263-1550(+)
MHTDEEDASSEKCKVFFPAVLMLNARESAELLIQIEEVALPDRKASLSIRTTAAIVPVVVARDKKDGRFRIASICIRNKCVGTFASARVDAFHIS